MFSPDGLTAKHEERGGSKKRLSPARVAALIARAAYNRLDMCWIAKHPVLLLGKMCSPSLIDTDCLGCKSKCVRLCSVAEALWWICDLLLHDTSSGLS